MSGRAITYFSLWATRLSGFLPDFENHPDRKLERDSRDLAARYAALTYFGFARAHWNKDTASICGGS